MTVRVLVADDQELVRAGFAMIVGHQDDLEIVGEAANGAEAVELAARTGPDVVLMDLRMPVMDGVTATREVAALAGPNPPRVLVLTTFDDDESVYASLHAGASGFLLKDVSPAELVAAVRAVAAGQALLAPQVTRRVIERFVGTHPLDPELRRRAEALTEREREVLAWMARGQTNSEIGRLIFVSEATVKSHVSHLLAKLGARDRAQAVAIGYEAGLLVPGSLEG